MMSHPPADRCLFFFLFFETKSKLHQKKFNFTKCWVLMMGSDIPAQQSWAEE